MFAQTLEKYLKSHSLHQELEFLHMSYAYIWWCGGVQCPPEDTPIITECCCHDGFYLFYQDQTQLDSQKQTQLWEKLVMFSTKTGSVHR